MASPQFTYESQTQAPVRISRRPESSSANVENVGGRLIMNGVSLVTFCLFFKDAFFLHQGFTNFL